MTLERISYGRGRLSKGYLDFYFGQDKIRLNPKPYMEILDSHGVGLTPGLMDCLEHGIRKIYLLILEFAGQSLQCHGGKRPINLSQYKRCVVFTRRIPI